MNLIKRIIKFFTPISETTLRDAYFSRAHDNVDLEYRMKVWDQQNPNLNEKRTYELYYSYRSHCYPNGYYGCS